MEKMKMKITPTQARLYRLVEQLGTPQRGLAQCLGIMGIVAEQQDDRAFFHEVVAQKGRLNCEYFMYISGETTRGEYTSELCKVRLSILDMIERLSEAE